jgi:hypothetical protein
MLVDYRSVVLEILALHSWFQEHTPFVRALQMIVAVIHIDA